MNNNDNDEHHRPLNDRAAVQIEPFVDSLKAAGYAANTLCTKRAALRRFMAWRGRLKPAGSDPNELEIAEFMSNECQLGPSHRCLASTALSAFLEHLRRCEVISTRAPAVPKTASSALEGRYAFAMKKDWPGYHCESICRWFPICFLTWRSGAVHGRFVGWMPLRCALFWRSVREGVLVNMSDSWPRVSGPFCAFFMRKVIFATI
jgi:hypothetical protein